MSTSLYLSLSLSSLPCGIGQTCITSMSVANYQHCLYCFIRLILVFSSIKMLIVIVILVSARSLGKDGDAR
ncbi:hypothetical protein F4680DRAFT_410076, partial [Xylaria scruposa]